MRTIRTKVYKFAELSDEGKAKAIELNSDINVDFNWWSDIYSDAEAVNLNISSFNIDRDEIQGKFYEGGFTTAKMIIENHGSECETYKLSAEFIEEFNEAVELHSDGINKNQVKQGFEFYFRNYIDDREELFLKEILEEYLILLRQDYENRLSVDSIKETLIFSDYEFLSNGKMY